jgi:hypothetical protein
MGIGQLVDLITLRRQVDEANMLEEARAMRAAGAPHKPSPEQLILRAAMKEGGKLTVTQAAMITGWSFQEAEGYLRELVKSGYVDVGNEPESGVVVYYFPELRGRRQLGGEGA